MENNKIKSIELLTEFYNPSEDRVGLADFDDTRRPRLTLLHLQRLRKSKDLQSVDRARHLEFIPDMYSDSPQV